MRRTRHDGAARINVLGASRWLRLPAEVVQLSMIHCATPPGPGLSRLIGRISKACIAPASPDFVSVPAIVEDGEKTVVGLKSELGKPFLIPAGDFRQRRMLRGDA